MRRTTGDDLRRRRSSTVPPGREAPPFVTGYGIGTDPDGGPGRVTAAADGVGAASVGASTDSPAAPIRPTTLSTATVSPSLTLICSSTPAAGDGISASTLSVEISNSGSSRSTASPTFLIQRTIVPSAIDSPIWGIVTGVGIQKAPGFRLPASGLTDESRRHELRERLPRPPLQTSGGRGSS